MYKRTIFVLFSSFAIALSGCVFDNLPGDVTGNLSAETGLSAAYGEASGSAVVKMVEGEIHVMVSDMPAAGDACSYVAYAITDEGSTSLGSFSLEAEAHHGESETHSDDEELEHAGDGEVSDHDGEESEHADDEAADHDEEGSEHSGDDTMNTSEDEEETTHFSGEIEANASVLGIHIHEVTGVEVYHECSSSNATKIFTVTFGSGSDSGSETSGSGGHAH